MNTTSKLTIPAIVALSLFVTALLGGLAWEYIRPFWLPNSTTETDDWWRDDPIATPEQVAEQVARTAVIQAGNSRILAIAPKGFLLVPENETAIWKTNIDRGRHPAIVTHAFFAEPHHRDRYLSVQSDTRLVGVMTQSAFQEIKERFASDEASGEIKRNLTLVNDRLEHKSVKIEGAKVVGFLERKDFFVITSLVEQTVNNMPELRVNSLACHLVGRNYVMVGASSKFTALADIQWAESSADAVAVLPQH